MKILEISRSYYPSVGGLEQFLENRFNIYDALGCDYQLITTKYSTGKFDYTKTNSKTVFLDEYTPYNITPALKKHLTKDYNLVSVNQVGRYFSDYTINYYHKKIPVLLTPHFTFHTGRYSFIKKIFSRLFLKNILNKADRIIAFTDFEKKYWMNHFNIPDDKIEVIPHYINVKNESDDSTDENYLLYLGRYDKNKRIDLLLESFSQNPKWKINLVMTVNKNEIPAGLLNKIINDKRIHLAGYVNEIEKKNLLRKCSALMYPSSFEAFGYSLLEASLYAKPVLCSNLEVFQEIICNEGAMRFENNVPDIKRVIEDFFTLSPIKKKEMGELNLSNLSRFTFEKNREQYKAVLEKLLNKSFSKNFK